MASGFKTYTIVSGTEKDLDEVFKLRAAGDPEFSGNSGFKTSDGLDLIKRYYPSSGNEDQYQVASGFRIQSLNLDFSQIFRAATFAGGLPTITENLEVQYIGDAGEAGSLSVVASGQEPLSYQWERNVGAGWVNVGADSATLSLSPLVAGDAGYYRVTVSNGVGSTVSSIAQLLVNHPPVIVSILPVAGTYNVGDSVDIVLVATDGYPVGIAYAWYKNGSPITSSTDGTYAGYTSDTLTITFELSDIDAVFKCRVTGPGGYVDSGTATFNVQYEPVITLNPSGGSINEGGTWGFAALADGNPAPDYQWQKYSGGAWGDIPGETNPGYILAGAALADAGSFRCVISNAVGTVYTPSAELFVQELPSIVVSPSNITDAEGSGPHQLLCEAAGAGGLYFTWYQNGVLVSGPRTGNISATEDQHVIGAVDGLWLQPSEAGDYYCVVTNSYGGTPATSATATVTVT